MEGHVTCALVALNSYKYSLNVYSSHIYDIYAEIVW